MWWAVSDKQAAGVLSPLASSSAVNRNLAACLPAGPPAASSTAPGVGAALERAVVKFKPETVTSSGMLQSDQARLPRLHILSGPHTRGV